MKMKKSKGNKTKKIIAFLGIVSIIIFIINYFVGGIKFTKMYNIASNKNNLGYQATLSSNATDVVKDMKIGWNLGNTLDSPDGKNRSVPSSYYETLWENPVTTEAMIKEVKNAGFNAVRVPVTWFDHVYVTSSSGEKVKSINISNMSVSEIKNIKIEEEWMSRVKEVVDYVDKNNMYCIINVHHDVGTGSWPWIFATNDSDKKAKYEAVLEMLWTQIAEEFKDYGINVLFEGYNEIMVEGATSWVGSNSSQVTEAHFKSVNDLNQVFVNTVRKSGGNNPSRFLVLNTYGAEALTEALDGFEFPSDTVKNHLILSAHVYDWGGTCRTGTNNTVYNSLQRLKTKADSNGAAAIIGEFGTRVNQAGISNAALALNYYVRTAKDFGITCFVWDDGMGKNSTMQLFNRTDLNWKHPNLVNGLIKGAAGKTISSSEIDTSVEPTKITLNKSNITIDYDSNYRETLTAILEPLNAGKSTKVTWKSSDTNIISVGYDGNIAPKGIPELINIQGPFAGGNEGTATITATITKEDNTELVASCQVTVKNKEKDKIENVNLSDFSNWRKGYYDWQKGYYFSNGENRMCVDGYLEVKPNTTYVAKISEDGLVYTVRELTEDHKYVVSSQNENGSEIIENGNKITTSANTKFLAVSIHKRASDGGQVTMNTSDFEKLFQKSGFKLQLSTEGSSTEEDIEPTSLSLDKTSETLDLNGVKELQLQSTITPSNANIHTSITWQSTSPDIADVDTNGKVTAKKVGTTTIVATTENGKSANCNITVKDSTVVPDPSVAVTSVVIAPNDVIIEKGNEITLTANVMPTNATNKEVTWVSDNNNIAAVDNGVVKGVGKGTAVITVKTVDGNFTDKATITVEDNSEEPSDRFKINVSYSTLAETENPVTVKITSESEMQEKSGWTLSTDKHTLEKVYTENVEEVIVVKDVNGNEATANIKVSNIKKKFDNDDDNKNNTVNNTTTNNNTTNNNTTNNNTTNNNTTNNNTTNNNTTNDNTTNNNTTNNNTTNNNTTNDNTTNNNTTNNNTTNNSTTNNNTLNSLNSIINSNSSNNGENKNQTQRILPYAGAGHNIFIVLITIFLATAIISYFKLRKNKDIK